MNGTGLSPEVANLQRQGRGSKPTRGHAPVYMLAHTSKSPVRASHTAANEPPLQGFGLVGQMTRGVAPGCYEIGPLALEPGGGSAAINFLIPCHSDQATFQTLRRPGRGLEDPPGRG